MNNNIPIMNENVVILCLPPGNKQDTDDDAV